MRHDYTGSKYGRLVVKEFVECRKNKYYYNCICECGKEKVICIESLVAGLTRSCGCLQAERARETLKKRKIDGTDLNSLNRGLQKNNSSGVKGVYLDKRTHKYVAHICFKGEQTRLGSFKTLEEATKARKEAEERIFIPFLEKYDETK